MEIKVQSIKFDADSRLLEFADKKLSKLSKFFDNIIRIDVALSCEPDHKKKAHVQVAIPGEDLHVEKVSDSFENAIEACETVLSDLLVKVKEKRFGK
ncbi:MAG: ribosome-associated translation inhibitor RaiA [Bacteroidales bacterium]|nr:ribosome-associated translation inhibitor RaiA [Bacteroidales bacterium]